MSAQMSDAVTVYTDGSCLGNPGPGGYAAIMQRGDVKRVLTGGERDTTNNRMELTAAIKAIQSMKTNAPMIIITDSQYVSDGITKWLPKWIKNGWRTADKKPVKNADLWQALLEAIGDRQIEWRWVRGHAYDPVNNEVDGLARQAAEKAAAER